MSRLLTVEFPARDQHEAQLYSAIWRGHLREMAYRRAYILSSDLIRRWLHVVDARSEGLPPSQVQEMLESVVEDSRKFME